jgi:hypothetical protein
MKTVLRNNMEHEIRHLTQRELAQRWSKSEATIERYRCDGVGTQYLIIGGKILYRLEDILHFENECLRLSPYAVSPPTQPDSTHVQ